jgi:hypothetical protein
VENVRPRGEFRMRVNIQLFITFQITHGFRRRI